jgi:hypothetical protein
MQKPRLHCKAMLLAATSTVMVAYVSVSLLCLTGIPHSWLYIVDELPELPLLLQRYTDEGVLQKDIPLTLETEHGIDIRYVSNECMPPLLY